MSRYFLINKPYHVLSQFTSHEGKQTLGDFFAVPKNVYAVGRLDYDSEGLLILTDDTFLNHRLLDPSHKHEREYHVQVEGTMTQEAIKKLCEGVEISIDGKPYKTLPARAVIFKDAPLIPERVPPIRYRKSIPTSWISLSLVEGKNRQVRKMTAKVGYPTLRLIRHRIVGLTLENLLPGDMKEVSKAELYNSLFL